MAFDRKAIRFGKKAESPLANPNQILTIDVMSVAYASYFGIKVKLSNAGQRTEVLYGFLDQLMTFYKTFRTRNIVFCFDSKSSVRKNKHPWYKKRDTKLKESEAKKKSEEFEEIFKQVYLLRTEILPSMGFENIVMQRGYEADDLIASTVIHNEGTHTVVTTDQDLFQLLDHCRIYQPRKKELMTKHLFEEKYQISPKQWVDVKRLGGCESDKIPGISRVGEITAIAFIKNELRAGKTLDSINEDMAKDESTSAWKRNEWLVRLPLPGTKKVALSFENQVLSIEGFQDVCEEHAFRFLDKKNRDDWLKFLQQK